jgi:nucleotidyltransferase substrate binding protein (TIGR01987 family)
MTNKLAAQRQQLSQAKDFLQRMLAEPESEMQRAATIQAFELLFELTWKYLKTLLEEDGMSIPASPKGVIREAGKHGFIDNPEVWFDFLFSRNLTVHTYIEAVAQKVYLSAKNDFLTAVNTLLDKTADQ